MKNWKKIKKSLVLGLVIALLGNTSVIPAFAMAPSENSERELEEDALKLSKESGLEKADPGEEAENKEETNEEAADGSGAGSGTNGNADGNMDSDADSEDSLHEQEDEEEKKEAVEEQTGLLCEPSAFWGGVPRASWHLLRLWQKAEPQESLMR